LQEKELDSPRRIRVFVQNLWFLKTIVTPIK
jgi:hypothetical protein